MFYVSLFLFFVVYSANSQTVIDWNANAEQLLERLNEQARSINGTVLRIPNGQLGGYKYEFPHLLGLDSRVRTKNCTLTDRGRCRTFDIHYGFRLAVIGLPSLTAGNIKMSAFVRSANNSFHFRLNHCRNPCDVRIEFARLESIGQLTFRASRPEYDGMDITGLFTKTFLPELQKGIDKSKVLMEQTIKSRLCMTLKDVPDRVLLTLI